MSRVFFAQIAALLAITPNLVSAFPLSPESTPTPTPLACPASDGKIFTVGPDSFNIHCGTDYYGGDLLMSWETSLENCITTCESTTGCIIVSYNGQACYMKNVDNGPQTNANIWAAKKVIASSSSTTSSSTSTSTATPTPTSVAVACPASNGTTYTANDGAIFKIECSVDRYGSDLAMTWVSDLQSCIETCDATTGCVDISYRPGTPGPCYMKNSHEQAVRIDSGVWGALRISTASPSTTTSSAASTTTSSATSSSTTSTTPSATPTPTPVIGTCGYIQNGDFETVPAGPLDWQLLNTTGTNPVPAVQFHYRNPAHGIYGLHIATNRAGDSATVGNTIQQLTPGFVYKLSFYTATLANGKIVINVDGHDLFTMQNPPNGGYYAGSLTFTATGTTAQLVIKNTAVGWNLFVIDYFTITAVTRGCVAATTTS